MERGKDTRVAGVMYLARGKDTRVAGVMYLARGKDTRVAGVMYLSMGNRRPRCGRHVFAFISDLALIMLIWAHCV